MSMGRVGLRGPMGYHGYVIGSSKYFINSSLGSLLSGSKRWQKSLETNLRCQLVQVRKLS